MLWRQFLEHLPRKPRGVLLMPNNSWTKPLELHPGQIIQLQLIILRLNAAYIDLENLIGTQPFTDDLEVAIQEVEAFYHRANEDLTA